MIIKLKQDVAASCINSSLGHVFYTSLFTLISRDILAKQKCHMIRTKKYAFLLRRMSPKYGTKKKTAKKKSNMIFFLFCFLKKYGINTVAVCMCGAHSRNIS